MKTAFLSIWRYDQGIMDLNKFMLMDIGYSLGYCSKTMYLIRGEAASKLRCGGRFIELSRKEQRSGQKNYLFLFIQLNPEVELLKHHSFFIFFYYNWKYSSQTHKDRYAQQVISIFKFSLRNDISQAKGYFTSP